MHIIDLTEDQAEDIEARLSAYDDEHMTGKTDGSIRIGAEENGRLIAGLDAYFTAFRILYVSTVFVDAEYRRKGIGTKLIREMEKKAAALGADTIRLDTFNWQGKEFYEALEVKVQSSRPAPVRKSRVCIQGKAALVCGKHRMGRFPAV